VYAQYKSKKHSLYRNAGSKLNSAMAEHLINKPSHVEMTSYFIARKFVIDEVVKYDSPYPYMAGLVFRVTQNIGGVYVEHRERQNGKSNYNFKKLVSLWFNGFTNFSVKPLRAASFMGFLFSITGFLTILFFILRKILDPNVPLGWTSTIVLIMFFGGIQLICIGLLGEYVGRVYLSINKTPQYVIKETQNIDKAVE
jgi:undecaprenyl-phosphate 4-deoxy-4-formamido-L-arabinose transferase